MDEEDKEYHLLGVMGSLQYFPEIQQEDFTLKIKVSEDVLEWLNAHDVKLSPEGSRIYVCNNIEYMYLGPVEETAIAFSTLMGEA